MHLSDLGLLGNALRTWHRIEALRKDPYCGYITIRARDKQSRWFVPVCHSDWEIYSSAGGKHYFTYGQELQRIWEDGGPDSSAFYFQEIPHPGSIRVANIEVGRIDFAPYFGLAGYIERYTTEPVRGIRERNRELTGLALSKTLEHVLRPESIEELYGIWDRYPEAIIEATEFSHRVGKEKK